MFHRFSLNQYLTLCGEGETRINNFVRGKVKLTRAVDYITDSLY